VSSDTLRTILREIAREEAKAAVAEEFAALLSQELPHPKGPSRRARARNGRRGWTEADKQSLVSDIRHGMTIYEAADKYGRTAAAIRDRLYHGKWGLLRNDRRPESPFTSPQQLL
jgi:hypothetical protein